MSKELKISAIICTKNRLKDTVECIHSLLNQTIAPYEVIIVDASSTDALNKELQTPLSGHSNIRYTYLIQQKGQFSGPSAGLVAGRNEGIKHASGDIILFLDDDVVLDTGYIENILDIYENDNEGEIGGVTGVPEAERRSGVIPFLRRLASFIFLIDSPNRGKVLRSGFHTGFDGLRSITDVDWLSGCNMSYRRQIFDGFSFEGPIGDDLDLSYRVSRKYRLKATPSAKLVHKFSEVESIAGRTEPRRAGFWAVYSRYYFLNKNMERSLLNAVCFAWAMMGLTMFYTFSFILRPQEKNLHMLRGALKGELKVAQEVLGKIFKGKPG